jgi:hypothetical protein
MASFRRFLENYGFAEIWPLYNATMTPRQAAKTVQTAVFCMTLLHCQGGVKGAKSPPTRSGGAELSMIFVPE